MYFLNKMLYTDVFPIQKMKQNTRALYFILVPHTSGYQTLPFSFPNLTAAVCCPGRLCNTYEHPPPCKDSVPPIAPPTVHKTHRPPSRKHQGQQSAKATSGDHSRFRKMQTLSESQCNAATCATQLLHASCVDELAQPATTSTTACAAVTLPNVAK